MSQDQGAEPAGLPRNEESSELLLTDATCPACGHTGVTVPVTLAFVLDVWVDERRGDQEISVHEGDPRRFGLLRNDAVIENFACEACERRLWLGDELAQQIATSVIDFVRGRVSGLTVEDGQLA